MKVAEILASAWRTETSRHFQPSFDEQKEPRRHVWASSFRSCDRRMALDLLHPNVRGDFDDSARERMLRGRDRERAILVRLERAGLVSDPPFEVVEAQSYFRLRDVSADNAVVITGKVDGRILFEGAGRRRPVFEVKAGRAVQRVQRYEDFARSIWTQHMPAQMLSYLLATGEPEGVFILDRDGDAPHFISVVLEDHLDEATSILERAGQAVLAAKGEAPVPPATQDMSHCAMCPHRGVTCVPREEHGDGAAIVTDQRVIDYADRLTVRYRPVERDEEAAKSLGMPGEATARDLARRVSAAEAALKKAVRGMPVALAGRHVITGKEHSRTAYDVPPEVRDKYRRAATNWRVELGGLVPESDG